MSGAVDSHTRNSLILSNELGWDLVSRVEDIKRYWHNSYDNLIYSYATFYSDVKHLNQIFERNPQARLFWLINEYNVGCNTFVYRYLIKNSGGIIANFVHLKMPKHPNVTQYTVNLNTIIYRDIPSQIRPTIVNPIYFGCYRPDREIYFRRYFKEKFIVSNSKKNLKKLAALGLTCRYVERLNWAPGHESLRNFMFGLYIEDVFTHTHYNFPANRFYEMLMCNTITFFDVNCRNTFNRYGLEIPDIFWVKDYKDLMSKCKKERYDEYLALQNRYKEKIKDERKDVIDKIHSIVNDE